MENLYFDIFCSQAGIQISLILASKLDQDPSSDSIQEYPTSSMSLKNDTK